MKDVKVIVCHKGLYDCHETERGHPAALTIFTLYEDNVPVWHSSPFYFKGEYKRRLRSGLVSYDDLAKETHQEIPYGLDLAEHVAGVLSTYAQYDTHFDVSRVDALIETLGGHHINRVRWGDGEPGVTHYVRRPAKDSKRTFDGYA